MNEILFFFYFLYINTSFLATLIVFLAIRSMFSFNFAQKIIIYVLDFFLNKYIIM